MPLPIRPACQPTSLGPLPHRDATAAWEAMLQHTGSLPALPLLKAAGESLASLGAEAFPGLKPGADEIMIDREATRRGLDALYANYLRGTLNPQPVELAALRQLFHSEQPLLRRSRAVFGVALGPISLALALIDEGAEPVLNDAQLLDALAKHIFLRRLWLHKMLERGGKPPVVWLYEPYLSAVETSFSPVSPDEAVAALDQALGFGLPRALWLPQAEGALALPPIERLDGLAMPLPPVEMAPTLGPLIKRLLEEKAALGWGIVPVTAEGLRSATVGRLAARFETWLLAVEAAGVAQSEVLAGSLIMPEDTLAYLEPAEAERALALTAELASLIRHSYGVE